MPFIDFLLHRMHARMQTAKKDYYNGVVIRHLVWPARPTPFLFVMLWFIVKGKDLAMRAQRTDSVH